MWVLLAQRFALQRLLEDPVNWLLFAWQVGVEGYQQSLSIRISGRLANWLSLQSQARQLKLDSQVKLVIEHLATDQLCRHKSPFGSSSHYRSFISYYTSNQAILAVGKHIASRPALSRSHSAVKSSWIIKLCLPQIRSTLQASQPQNYSKEGSGLMGAGTSFITVGHGPLSDQI